MNVSEYLMKYKFYTSEYLPLLESENDLTITYEDFVAILNRLSSSFVYVVSGADRKIKKFRSNRYSNVPFSEGDRIKAEEKAIEEPALILTKQEGLKENGWNDAQFWWPILVVQENAKTSVYADGVAD